MRKRLGPAILLTSLVASCVVHGWVILPALISTMTSARPDAPRSIPARFEAPLTQSELEIETPLGIDADTPSSFTWIGHEEYEEQMAELSEVEQAAFTSTPGTPGNPSTPAAPVQPPQDASAPPDPVTEAPAPAAASPMSPGGDVMAAAQSWMDMLTRAGAETKQDNQEASPREETPTPEPPEKPKPTEKPKPPAPEPSPTPPQEDSGTPESAPGAPAEQDSDATSTIDLDELKLGKPIARPGLDVKPRRPKITTLTMLTSAPGSPLVEIRFGADGKPKTARVVESSGDARIDRALETSLYRWRARGDQIKELTGDRTVTVTIRILLGR